jgi:hypothetical protein
MCPDHSRTEVSAVIGPLVAMAATRGNCTPRANYPCFFFRSAISAYQQVMPVGTMKMQPAVVGMVHAQRFGRALTESAVVLECRLRDIETTLSRALPNNSDLCWLAV